MTSSSQLLEANSAAARPPATQMRTWTEPWWVLRTRSRHEKVLAALLQARCVNYYLPLVEVRHTYAKSKAAFRVPLFPSYLFISLAERGMDWVKRDKRVVQVLSVADKAALVNELIQIERVLVEGQPVDLYPQLKVGAHCRINAGPLKGIEGEVEQLGSKTRIYLRVSILAQSICVEVDASMLDYITA